MKPRQVTIVRGSHRMTLSVDSQSAWRDGLIVRLSAAPYQSGGQVMIPLRDVVDALDETLIYDAKHRIANVVVGTQPFSNVFTAAPKPRVAPTTIFTPRPVATPTAAVTPVVYPRRTPIPIRAMRLEPPR